jgi:hypothetical protein
MNITIKKIISDTPIKIGFVPTDGFWVEFESIEVQGQAIYVPYDPATINQLCGQSFFAEPNYERIENFRRCADAEREVSIVPLPENGSFRIVGQVQSVMPTSDVEKQFLFNVVANDVCIMLAGDEVKYNLPEEGEFVSFDIIELSLWDENF